MLLSTIDSVTSAAAFRATIFSCNQRDKAGS